MRTAILLILAAASAAVPLQSRNYDIIFERIEGHEANPEYFGPSTGMFVRRVDKNAPAGLFDTLEIIKPLPNDTVVEVIVYERRDNKYVPSFLKYKNNMCDYLAKEKRPVFQDFGKIFKFPPSCPLVGTFSFKNYRPDDSILPPFLPGPEHWKIYFGLSSGKTNLVRHSIVFLIDRSKGIRGGNSPKSRSSG